MPPRANVVNTFLRAIDTLDNAQLPVMQPSQPSHRNNGTLAVSGGGTVHANSDKELVSSAPLAGDCSSLSLAAVDSNAAPGSNAAPTASSGAALLPAGGNEGAMPAVRTGNNGCGKPVVVCGAKCFVHDSAATAAAAAKNDSGAAPDAGGSAAHLTSNTAAGMAAGMLGTEAAVSKRTSEGHEQSASRDRFKHKGTQTSVLDVPGQEGELSRLVDKTVPDDSRAARAAKLSGCRRKRSRPSSAPSAEQRMWQTQMLTGKYGDFNEMCACCQYFWSLRVHH